MKTDAPAKADPPPSGERLAFVVASLRLVGRLVLPVVRRFTSVIRPLGWFLIGAAVIGWIVGVTFGWFETLSIAAASGFVLVICGFFLFGKSALEVAIELHPQRTVVGQPANGQIVVKNGSTGRLLPSRVDLVIGKSMARFATPSLGSGEVHEDLFRISTDRRGIINVGPAQVVRADPIGVFGRVVSHTDPELLYVHPRTVKVDGAGAGFLRDLEGRESADLSPSDLAFHSLREYVPGDDRRHVHWRTSARVGRLMVQQFVDTRRSRVLLVLDEDSAAYQTDEDFETAVSTIGSIGVQVIREGQTRTVVSGDRMLGSVSTSTLLDALSGVESHDRHGGLVNSVAVGSRHCPDASLVVMVTGKMTTVTEARASAHRFSLSTRIVVIMVGDGKTGFQKLENMLIFNVKDLEELSPVMNVVVTT